jgi:hypothetical protein
MLNFFLCLLDMGNKRKRMDNKMSLQYDDPIVLSNSYMMEQIVGDNLYKLVSERKKLPLSAKGMWRYERMREKDIFSEPLIQMRLGFPRTRSHDETRGAHHRQEQQQRGLVGAPPNWSSVDLPPAAPARLDLHKPPPAVAPPCCQHRRHERSGGKKSPFLA